MGASIEVITNSEEDPRCMQTTVPSSAHALQKGSQWSVWIEGQPSLEGFSEKVTAWQPRPAIRWTSSAASSGSQSTGIERGMNRPGSAPHHPSTCQSLYAFTMASASPASVAAARANSWPQNWGKEGKHIEP